MASWERGLSRRVDPVELCQSWTWFDSGVNCAAGTPRLIRRLASGLVAVDLVTVEVGDVLDPSELYVRGMGP